MDFKVGVGVLSLGAVLVLGACEEKKGNKLVIGTRSVACDLTLDTLAGTTWVIERINPDKSVEPDIQTRLKVYAEDGATRIKYNVGSLSDMYEYECADRAGELACWEDPPKVRDFCLSLEAGGAECTAERLRELAPTASDSDITEGMKKAEEVLERFRDTPKWEAFVFQNNNLGNKLGGIVYMKVDTKRCKLRITDNYMTIYNGKKLEDSNPVGTNYFLRSDEELFWEHCTDSGDLIAKKESEFPKTAEEAVTCAPNSGCTLTVGDTINYHYIGQDGRTAKEGCTYSFDAWLNWKPHRQGVAAPVVDWKQGRRKVKEVRYPLSATFSEAGAQVMEIVRYQTCEGKPKEQVEVACNLVLVK